MPSPSDNIQIAALAERLAACNLNIADNLKLLKGGLSDRLPVLPMIFSREVSPANLLAWLYNQPELPRIYWSSREGDFEIAGSGTALILDSRDAGIDPIGFIRSIEQIIGGCGDLAPFFIGGFRFDRKRAIGRQWQSFPTAWFAVPDSVLVRAGARYFRISVMPVATDTTSDHIEDVVDRSELPPKSGLDSAVSFNADAESRSDTPDRGQWQESIQQCLRSIQSNEAHKIVMARRTDFKLTEEIDPISLYSTLAERTGRCFGFMVELDHGGAFLGASPERLFRVTDRTLITEAVAGTPKDDATAKETSEHRFVEDFVMEAARKLCVDPKLTETRSPLVLEHISHLRSEIMGRLRDGVGIADVMSQLHPTPAVGGDPRDNALEIIRRIEPFDRGWYAAPFGVMTYGFTDFSVSIRSAVLSSSALSIYAGAGIVPGSDPDAEWEELERKIAPHLTILGGVTA